ncbi:MAG: acetolactate decarboxylase [Victivallales bacterium]|nr:acetolactate decarboxylase [Victivallales bacterium]
METTTNRQGVFTQISLFSVLLGGRYGGVCSIADVKKHGNMAIATMDRLDGEMQMIDGVVYQACADGRLLLPKDDETIPFGTIAKFTSEQELHLGDIPCFEDFEERMKTECPGLNLPLAVYLKGDFLHVKSAPSNARRRTGSALPRRLGTRRSLSWMGYRGTWWASVCQVMSRASMRLDGICISWTPRADMGGMWLILP